MPAVFSLCFLVATQLSTTLLCAKEPEMPLGIQWTPRAMLHSLQCLLQAGVLFQMEVDPEIFLIRLSGCGCSTLAAPAHHTQKILEAGDQLGLVGLASHGTVGLLAMGAELPRAEGHLPGALCLACPRPPTT